MLADNQILILFKFLELVMGGLLMVAHSKSEFLVPSLGYGTPVEVVAAMSTFSMMVVPLAARLQAAIIKPNALYGVVDAFIPLLAIWVYAVAGILTLYGWIRSRTRKNVFFRSFFNQFLLGKGLFSMILMIVLCLDAAFCIIKIFRDTGETDGGDDTK